VFGLDQCDLAFAAFATRCQVERSVIAFQAA
jgi:hypothetical protein